jgi:hypothetical protein
MSLAPLVGVPEPIFGVPLGESLGVEGESKSSEADDLLRDDVESLELERTRVVPLPWTVVPPKLVSLPCVLLRLSGEDDDGLQ